MASKLSPVEEIPTASETEHRKRSLSPSTFRKPCSLCNTPSDVLVRCRIDATQAWHLVCPKKCWKAVSGGEVDGDAVHPHYQYGGMWKNKHALVSAKKPKHKKGKATPALGIGEGTMMEPSEEKNNDTHYLNDQDRGSQR